MDEYNNITKGDCLDVFPVTKEEVMQGQFPWSELSGNYNTRKLSFIIVDCISNNLHYYRTALCFYTKKAASIDFIL